jgi:hypothetical protein
MCIENRVSSIVKFSSIYFNVNVGLSVDCTKEKMVSEGGRLGAIYIS